MPVSSHVVTSRSSTRDNGKTFEIPVQLEQVAGAVSGHGEDQPVIAVGKDMPVVGDGQASRVGRTGYSLPRGRGVGVGYLQAAHQELAIRLRRKSELRATVINGE